MIFPDTLDRMHLHLDRLPWTQLYENSLRDGRCWWACRKNLCLFALRDPLQMPCPYFRIVVKDRGIRAISRRGGVARTLDLEFEDDRIAVGCLVVGTRFHLQEGWVHIHGDQSKSVRKNLVHDDGGIVPHVYIFYRNCRNLQPISIARPTSDES